MGRLFIVLTAAFLLSGCDVDSGFERGYIISHSESDVECSSNCVEE